MTTMYDFVTEMPNAESYDVFTRDGKWVGTVIRWYDTIPNEEIIDIDVARRAVTLAKGEWEL